MFPVCARLTSREVRSLIASADIPAVKLSSQIEDLMNWLSSMEMLAMNFYVLLHVLIKLQ